MMLIERMKPQYKEELEKQLEIYPATLNRLVDELKTKSFYIEMSYECIILLGYLGVKDFNPATISSVFSENLNEQ